jgi:hypothetical protein
MSWCYTGGVVHVLARPAFRAGCRRYADVIVAIGGGMKDAARWKGREHSRSIQARCTRRGLDSIRAAIPSGDRIRDGRLARALLPRAVRATASTAFR